MHTAVPPRAGIHEWMGLAVLVKFDSYGDLMTEWGTHGNGDGQFLSSGSCYDLVENVYVVDYGNDRIQKFQNNGEFLAKWGTSGNGAGQFQEPEGVGIDSEDNIYVADTNNHRIQKFDNNGNFITMWGSEGRGDYQFIEPISIEVDFQDNIYVVVWGLKKLKFFASSSE
jgi:tripartite motif-containing protein 71